MHAGERLAAYRKSSLRGASGCQPIILGAANRLTGNCWLGCCISPETLSRYYIAGSPFSGDLIAKLRP
jgi:hypothetical protein